MAVRRNGMWNNPEIGQAFDNLSSLFGPPKGTDILAYAKARQTVDQTGRLAELFRQSQDPNFDQSRFDRGNIANQSYTPAQSYYAVDQSNATSRSNNAATIEGTLQKQRIENEGKIATTGIHENAETGRYRYGVEVDAGTKRATNAADNARIQQVEDAKRSELARQFDEADLTTKPGDTTIVSPRRQAALNLPEPMVRGNIDLKPGETVVTPGGETFQGQAKPQSYDEWKAQEAARAAGAGEINPVDVILGQNAPVKTVDDSGNTRYMAPGAAARTGAVAAPDAAVRRTDAVAVLKDGTRVPVTRGPGELGFVDANRQPIPPDAQIMQLPQAKGTGADIGITPTTSNQTDANKQEANLAATEDQIDGVVKILKENPAIAGVGGSIRGLFQDAAATAREFTAVFGKEASSVVDPSKIDEYAARLSPTRNPLIHEFNTRMLGLAYAHAKVNNPSGEVSRQALERSMSALGSSGILSNNQSTLEGLNGFKSQIASKRLEIKSLRQPGGGAPGAPAAPAAVEEWTRGPDGKLQRVR